MTCEACEFVDTFHLAPDYAVILNVDADHLITSALWKHHQILPQIRWNGYQGHPFTTVMTPTPAKR